MVCPARLRAEVKTHMRKKAGRSAAARPSAVLADAHVASLAEVQRLAALRTRIPLLRSGRHRLHRPVVQRRDRLIRRRKLNALADHIRTG